MRQWSEQKCPIFKTVAKGDSKPDSLDCESDILQMSYRALRGPMDWILRCIKHFNTFYIKKSKNSDIYYLDYQSHKNVDISPF